MPGFRLTAVALLCLVAFMGASCNDSSEKDELRERCLQAREVVVDQRVTAGGSATPADLKVELEKHRIVLHRSLGDRFVSHCEGRGRAYAACLTTSTNPDDSGRCERLP